MLHEVSLVEGQGTLGHNPGPCQFEDEQKNAAQSGNELKSIVDDGRECRAWRALVGGGIAASSGRKFCSVDTTKATNNMIANRRVLRAIVET